MSEHLTVATWLYQILSADATLAGLIGTRIYDTLAPQDAAYPFIVFQQQSSRDVRGATESTRVMASGLYTIRGVAQSPTFTGNLATIEGRIDALLHHKSAASVSLNSVVIGGIVASYREQQFSMTEAIDGGIPIRHLGGIYRIMAQRA